MAEWFKAAVLKTASRKSGRGFESYSLRHEPRRVRGMPCTPRGAWRHFYHAGYVASPEPYMVQGAI